MKKGCPRLLRRFGRSNDFSASNTREKSIAGAEGIEPPTAVLETAVIPLN